MTKCNAKNHARQSRRQRRRQRQRERKKRRRVGQRAITLPSLSQPISFEELLARAERLARPGDRLQVIYVSGECAERFGLPNDGEEYPIWAALESGEDVSLQTELEPSP